MPRKRPHAKKPAHPVEHQAPHEVKAVEPEKPAPVKAARKERATAPTVSKRRAAKPAGKRQRRREPTPQASAEPTKRESPAAAPVHTAEAATVPPAPRTPRERSAQTKRGAQTKRRAQPKQSAQPKHSAQPEQSAQPERSAEPEPVKTAPPVTPASPVITQPAEAAQVAPPQDQAALKAPPKKPVAKPEPKKAVAVTQPVSKPKTEAPPPRPAKKPEPKKAPVPAKVPAKAAAAAPGPAIPVTPIKPVTPVKPIVPLLPPIVLGEFTLEVLRPDDLLSLYLNFVNLRLDTSNTRNPKLVIQDASNPAYLVVWFAPQSILEQAFFETGNNTTNPGFNNSVPEPPTVSDPLLAPGSFPSYVAGRSRLVFEVPASVKEIPYTIEGLLDWSNLKLTVSPVALGTPLPPPITAPTFLQTAIEIPWRIVLSPENGVGWAHATEPETFAGRTAMWHTRLGQIKTVTSGNKTVEVLDEASESNLIPLRAIWSDDFTDHGTLPLLGNEVPYRSSLDPHDRMQIVILTSGTLGYTVPGTFGPGGQWTPQPIEASRLFLSALGGYLSSRGSWPVTPTYTSTTGAPQELDLIEWEHQATMGRDQYVRVVYAGYLYPFGHPASLIKVTERKVVPPDGGVVTQATAYLRQHMYIVVRRPEMTYGSEPYQHGKREMPLWQGVRIKTKVTPDIDIPVMLTGDGNPHQSFWVTAGGQYFQFHVEATDLSGKNIDFLAPMVFVSDSEEFPGGVQSIYAGNDAVRVCTLNGQKIAYADPEAGDTTLRTTELYFTTELQLTKPPYPIPPFIPCLDKATATIPSVEQILGTASPVTITLYSGYLQNGLDSNAGVYASITNPQPTIGFSAGQSGGFSTPVLVLTSLSARKGLVAGKAADAAAGNINPAEFFDLSAKLFGTVPLQKLIPVNSSNLASAAQNAPEIRTVLQPNSKNPTSTVTKIQWAPQLQDYEQDPVKVQFNQNGLSSALTLKAVLTRNMTGGPPTSEISGQLTNFQLNLLGVISLTINSIKFSSNNGQKMNVTAKLPNNSPVQFIGPLSFVQALANVLPPGVFGGAGPSVDLEPSQIVVSYTLGLPPVGVGVFSLENISITLGLDLPYLDGTPGFEFAFAKRNSPFLITVECLGGGGFVHLIVTANGVQMVEGSLEFGGEFSLDLGVASGSVHAMAGIYFKLAGTSSDLTGFVDVGGEVSVLGIISVSLDLNLSLSYQTTNGKSFVQGRATMTVAVHVLFFSASVSISVERSFAANPGDPRVGSVLDAQDWSEYAAAFA